jgi:3-oxoacyl-[acyl-carrier-protein] synthase-3
MANLTIPHVSIAGISAAVPKDVYENSENPNFDKEYINKFIESTGVHRIRKGGQETCTSDLSFYAAEQLIDSLGWKKDEIDIVLFISQTPDYYTPITSALLQDRLKLSTKCIAFDLTLGCSGYVYGLSTIASYMSLGKLRKGLLLCGDTPSKICNPKDQTVAMLFCDSSTATALEFNENAPPMHFSLGTDGSGYKAIIIPEGGFRTPTNENTLVNKQYEDGAIRRGCDLFLDGMEVFSFGITQAPKSVKELCEYTQLAATDMDYVVFHQANMKMNEMIRKKLKLDTVKVPYSLENFGNTSSASIPITLVTELREQLQQNRCKLILCGFGVGLSWGTCYVETDKIVVPQILEI